jgi:hypothetical protein
MPSSGSAPQLIYTGITDVVDLKRLLASSVENFNFIAISPSGEHVALLTKRTYSVFKVTPPSLVCTGEFDRKGVYRYSNMAIARSQSQTTPPTMLNFSGFACAAGSDRHVVIGAGGKIMLFAIDGNCAGRLVHYEDIKDSSICSINFSPDGMELLTLLSGFEKGECIQQARIYATDGAQEDASAQNSTFVLRESVVWNSNYFHSIATFLNDGR